MNIVVDHDRMRVTGLDRLGASNCTEFKQMLKLHLNESCQLVEVDCALIRFIDSDGLGALISIHKWLAPRAGKLRLREPLPVVRQLLRLLHFDEIFEITP
jgi:anti-sigma B factor antagonist